MFHIEPGIAMNKTSGSQNQGEGGRDAAHHSNAASEKFAKSGKVGSGAKDAKDAPDGPEKSTLKRAEEEGRPHAKS
jgi:hypothetical protein